MGCGDTKSLDPYRYNSLSNLKQLILAYTRSSSKWTGTLAHLDLIIEPNNSIFTVRQFTLTKKYFVLRPVFLDWSRTELFRPVYRTAIVDR